MNGGIIMEKIIKKNVFMIHNNFFLNQSKLLLIIIALFLFIKNSSAQKITELTWYGLDFSLAKMIGSPGFRNPSEIKNYYFGSWNNVIITESDKFNLKKYYGKKFKTNLAKAEERNKQVDYNELITDDSYELTSEQIKNVISNYNNTGDGYGLVYVVESFDKVKESAFIWVCLFNEKTGEAFYMNKFNGKPGGFGIRNYWVNSVLDVMQKSGKKLPVK
jgi:hypothetical protein